MGFVESPTHAGHMTQSIAGQPSESVKANSSSSTPRSICSCLRCTVPIVIRAPVRSMPPTSRNTVEVFDTGVAPQPSPRWHEWRPSWEATIERYDAEGEPTNAPEPSGDADPPRPPDTGVLIRKAAPCRSASTAARPSHTCKCRSGTLRSACDWLGGRSVCDGLGPQVESSEQLCVCGNHDGGEAHEGGADGWG